VPHFSDAAISAPASNGANGSGNGQHAVTDGTPVADQGQVAVPGASADPDTWAPPPWPPPTNPASGAPEGPAAR
jgi:hypothetical protein